MRREIFFFLVGLFCGLSCLPAHAAGRAGKQDLAELAEFKRVQETNSRILADTGQEIVTIRQEIQSLKGAIEESKHFFDEATQQNEKILKDFDLRLTGMEERLSLYGSQLQDFLSKGDPGVKTTNPALAAEEDDLYKKALGEINTQNYKAAIPLFDQFLKKFPKSSMADNAQYWKGEALYALKRFPEAVLEFQKVIRRFPKSDKVPAAVLKQGYCFFEAKEYLDAKAFLQKVATDFPRSEEAIKAKEKIQQINQVVAKTPQKPVR